MSVRGRKLPEPAGERPWMQLAHWIDAEGYEHRLLTTSGDFRPPSNAVWSSVALLQPVSAEALRAAIDRGEL